MEKSVPSTPSGELEHKQFRDESQIMPVMDDDQSRENSQQEGEVGGGDNEGNFKR